MIVSLYDYTIEPRLFDKGWDCLVTPPGGEPRFLDMACLKLSQALERAFEWVDDDRRKKQAMRL